MAFMFNFKIETPNPSEGNEEKQSVVTKKRHNSNDIELDNGVKKSCPATELPVAQRVTYDWTSLVADQDNWDTEAVFVCEGIILECVQYKSVEHSIHECQLNLRGKTQDKSKIKKKKTEQEESNETLDSIQSEQISDTSSNHCTTQESSSNTSSTNVTNGFGAALSTNSDLVSGIYEGGLKVWECAIDLIEYLVSSEVSFPSLKVLELGCGAGLPGVFALQQGATHVTFQDYNKEVLELVTVRNVLLNCGQDMEDSSFFSGDWAALAPLLEDNSYDMILTSETIYNPSTYPHLLGLMKTVLKPTGIVYLAAKTCYFGVGGGVRQWEEYVQADGTFDVHTCHEITEGVHREIMKLEFKSKESDSVTTS